MSIVPGISTHRLLALLGVLAVATGTAAGVAVAGALAVVVLTREVAGLLRHVPADVG